MSIVLHGVIRHFDQGHEHVDVVVTEGAPYILKTHQVGVDVKVNRGIILTFLAERYGISPGDIVWPDHIILEMNET